MKWLLQRDYEHAATYHLYDGGHHIATLKYNAVYHSVRVVSSRQRRTFFLRGSGLFSSRITLLNEYGQAIGKSSFPDRKEEGDIEMEAVPFHYSFDETLPAVLLADGNSKSLIKVCRLAFVRSMNIEEQLGLLLCLTWLVVEATRISYAQEALVLANH